MQNSDQRTIQTKDKRKAQFYWTVWTRRQNSTLMNQPNSSEWICREINKGVANINKEFDRKSAIENMIKTADTHLLTDIEISWIDEKEKRLINWLWMIIGTQRTYAALTTYLNDQSQYVSNLKNLNNEANGDHNIKLVINEDIYNTFGLLEKPQSIKEMHTLIIKFLDFMLIPSNYKRELCERLKRKWIETSKFEKFKWLNQENLDQNMWALDYIETYRKNDVSFLFHKAIYSWSTNRERYYEHAIAIIDTWQIPYDTKELFIIKMKKAWYQKKHRDKLDGKKPCSFNLSQATKDQLDYLSKRSSKHKNEIIEELINTEHQQVNNK